MGIKISAQVLNGEGDKRMVILKFKMEDCTLLPVSVNQLREQLQTFSVVSFRLV